MPIQIINGFPQYFEFGHQYARFYGNALTQEFQDYTDIDLMTDTIGDPMSFEEADVQLMTITRDGATVLNDAGYDIIAQNVIRLTPGLLNGEIVEFKKLRAVAEIGNIPVDPTPGEPVLVEKTQTEAVCWTDSSGADINAYPAYLEGGKTAIKTHFVFDPEDIEIYINGQFISGAMLNELNEPYWTVFSSDIILLDKDYSALKTNIQIIKKTYGEI